MSDKEKYDNLKKDYDEFVYVVSHDFKSVFRKLSSLVGWIKEDIESGDFDEVEKQIHLIQESAKHMDSMLDGLTNISRVDRLSNTSSNFSLNDLILEIKENLCLESVSIKISNSISIQSSKEKAYNILKEVIHNAAVFNSKADKKIEITLTKEDDSVLILVTDNGDGIYDNDLEKPFKLFYNEKFKTGIESIGCGLTYARKLAESENGFVSIISSTEKGTKVQIRLPLSATK